LTDHRLRKQTIWASSVCQILKKYKVKKYYVLRKWLKFLKICPRFYLLLKKIWLIWLHSESVNTKIRRKKKIENNDGYSCKEKNNNHNCWAAYRNMFCKTWCQVSTRKYRNYTVYYTKSAKYSKLENFVISSKTVDIFMTFELMCENFNTFVELFSEELFPKQKWIQ